MRWWSAPRWVLGGVGGGGWTGEGGGGGGGRGQKGREGRGWACRHAHTPWLALVLVLSWSSLNVLAIRFPGSAQDSAVPLLAADVCEFRTVNYITHTLPQQCLRGSWTVPAQPASIDSIDSPATATAAAGLLDPTTSQATFDRQPPQADDGRGHVAGSAAGGRGEYETRSAATASSPSKPEAEHGHVGEEEPRQDLPVPSLEDAADLASSTFMSFDEWKEMTLRKAGQDLADAKGRKHRPSDQPRADRDRGDAAIANSSGEPVAALGAEDGHMGIDYDALSEKISQMTGSSTSPSSSPGDDGDQGGDAPTGEASQQQQNQVRHEDGHVPYPRSKDAGKTCKERFSYASFDAGATVIKASPGAKNAKAILVENKDSYMLLECHAANKFVIVELSDDILIDTVVLANFEFFSSMVRHFRVSVSDRWPPRKPDQWVDLGTFEARNSRDMQPFLIQHPQIYSKYLRIEFLSHYGNEFYCPVSLLRVHGTRMLDTWKDPEPEGGQEDEAETIDGYSAEAVNREDQVGAEHAVALDLNEPAEPVGKEQPVNDVEEEEPSQGRNPPAQPSLNMTDLTPWRPMLDAFSSLQTCAALASTPVQPAAMLFQGELSQCYSTAPPGAMTTRDHTATAVAEAEGPDAPTPASSPTTPAQPPSPSDSQPSSPPSTPTEQAASSVGGDSSSDTPGTSSSSKQASSTSPDSAPSATFSSPPSSSSSLKPPPPSGSKPSSHTTAKPPPNATAGAPHNSPKTPPSSTSTAAGPAQPTVQESFFKSVSKRLQQLEANTSLSVQYLEEQSRVLREAFRNMERRHAGHINTLFLEGLNHTGMPQELRALRTQYDELWQSTVLALEAQHDQQARETVALGRRLELLADEVVFQRRMAIFQSVLLLGCLLLIIFSNTSVGGLAARYVIPTPGAPLPAPAGGIAAADGGGGASANGRSYAHSGSFPAPALVPSANSSPDRGARAPTLREGAHRDEWLSNPDGSWEEGHLASPILSPVGGFSSRQYHQYQQQQQQQQHRAGAAAAASAGGIPILADNESSINQGGYGAGASGNRYNLYKSLPLTPTSGCSPGGTPTIQIDSPVDDDEGAESSPFLLSSTGAAQRPASSCEEEEHGGVEHTTMDEQDPTPSHSRLVSLVSSPHPSTRAEERPTTQRGQADARQTEPREEPSQACDDEAKATRASTAMLVDNDLPALSSAAEPALPAAGYKPSVAIDASVTTIATTSGPNNESHDPEAAEEREAASQLAGRRPARSLMAGPRKPLPSLPEDPI